MSTAQNSNVELRLAEVADRVHGLRLDMGLSPEEVASKLDISACRGCRAAVYPWPRSQADHPDRNCPAGPRFCPFFPVPEAQSPLLSQDRSLSE